MKFTYVFLLTYSLVNFGIGDECASKRSECVQARQLLLKEGLEEAKQGCQYEEDLMDFIGSTNPNEMNPEIIAANITQKSIWTRIAAYLNRTDLGENQSFLLAD